MKSGVDHDGTYRLRMRKMTREDIRVGVDFWLNMLGDMPLHGTITNVIDKHDTVLFEKEGDKDNAFEVDIDYLLNVCQIII